MKTLLQKFKFSLLVTLLFILIDVNTIVAQTDIPAGNVYGTWTNANSPYHVNGHITVPKDSTLTIEPGVSILFTGSYKLDVIGCVIAVGSATDTITFTAENHTTGWQSVKFMNTAPTSDSSRFVYCKMEYGNLNQGGDLDRSGGSFAIMNFSKLVISHCLLQNNTVVNTGSEMSGGGGAIGIINASPKITNNTIISNQCTGPYGAGGAIICWSNANPLIANNLISGNKAYFAGGIYVGISQPVIANNIITENHAAGRGGGVHCYNRGNPVLINNTIVNNWGNIGGGLDCNNNCDPIVINSILYGDTSPNGNEVTLWSADCDPVFINCVISGGKESFGDAGAGANYSGLYKNNLDADPQFEDTLNNDFHLQDESPCISKGSAKTVFNKTLYYAPSTDFEGNLKPSPALSAPDIGALENAAGDPDTTRPADQFLRGVYHFNQDSIQYRLFVPNYSGNSERFPLVLTLHGTSSIGFDNNSQITRNRNAEAWAEDSAQLRNPAFVLAPQVHLPSSMNMTDLKPYCISTVLPKTIALLDSIIAEYPVDTTRLYITGFSFGAILTWCHIYWLRPGRFAAAIPISGKWDLDWAPQINRIPVWAFHGALDNTFPVTESRSLMQKLADANIEVHTNHSIVGDIGLTESELDSLLSIKVNHIYTEYTGAGHDNDVWNLSYDDPLLHRWLFAQKNDYDFTGFESKESATTAFRGLLSNYPNPFNTSTEIQVSILNQSWVKLQVFDCSGRLVDVLVNNELQQGEYQITYNAGGLSAGIYYCSLITTDGMQYLKLQIIK